MATTDHSAASTPSRDNPTDTRPQPPESSPFHQEAQGNTPGTVQDAHKFFQDKAGGSADAILPDLGLTNDSGTPSHGKTHEYPALPPGGSAEHHRLPGYNDDPTSQASNLGRRDSSSTDSDETFNSKLGAYHPHIIDPTNQPSGK